MYTLGLYHRTLAEKNPVEFSLYQRVFGNDDQDAFKKAWNGTYKIGRNFCNPLEKSLFLAGKSMSAGFQLRDYNSMFGNENYTHFQINEKIKLAKISSNNISITLENGSIVDFNIVQ